MITPRVLSCFMLIASSLLSCVAEPHGIVLPKPTDDSGEEPTGGDTSRPSMPSATACEVLRALEDKCGRCHGTPAEHGAPFSLISPADLREVDRNGVTRRERAAAAIESGRMPARFIQLDPPVEELSDGQRELLSTWLRGDEDPDAPCE